MKTPLEQNRHTLDKIHILSRAVILDKGKLLLCQTVGLVSDIFFLPGGHIEHGESAQKALYRELKEETGVECEITQFLGCLEYGFEPTHPNICHNHEYNLIFEARSKWLQSHQEIKGPEDNLQLKWVPMTDLIQIPLKPASLIQQLPKWIAEKPNTQFVSEIQWT